MAMCLITNDAKAISIEVEYETIIIRSDEVTNNFSMHWAYPGYGNERVQQIAKPYHLQLMKAQREEDEI